MRSRRLRAATLVTALLLAGCAARAPAQATTAPATRPDTRPSTRPAAAEGPAAEYVEYRARADLGVIRVANGSVRGEAAVRRLTERAADLAGSGVFACTDERRRHAHRRSERMGGRKIDTLVLIDPPPADDEDAYWVPRLVILVDGRCKVDCTIGTTADGELWVSQVTIFPEDGTLEFRALTADGLELGLPESWLRLDDSTVITDDSFFEDPPEDGGGGPAMKA